MDKQPQILEDEWRKQIRELSDEGLIRELDKPTGHWNEDVLRESIKRLIQK